LNGQGQPFGQDLFAWRALEALVLKPPKWSGSAQAIGDKYLLESGNDTVKHAAILLEKFGKGRIGEVLQSCRAAYDSLKVCCKGGPDGSSWTQGLPADPSTSDILAAFDKYLKDINEEEAMEKMFTTAQKALSCRPCTVFRLPTPAQALACTSEALLERHCLFRMSRLLSAIVCFGVVWWWGRVWLRNAEYPHYITQA
jgi:hypothetical protein